MKKQIITTAVRVPYALTDDKTGEKRTGVTPKICVLETDSDSGAVLALRVEKCSPDFPIDNVDLHTAGELSYDRFGRVLRFVPDEKQG